MTNDYEKLTFYYMVYYLFPFLHTIIKKYFNNNNLITLNFIISIYNVIYKKIII